MLVDFRFRFGAGLLHRAADFHCCVRRFLFCFFAEDFGLDVVAVKAALAYYESHKDEIERIIDQHERAMYDD